MADIKIKIVSNPYQEIVRFFRWDNGWQEITTSTNPNSALLSTKIVNGFFPFKAEEIIDILAKEFGGGDKIELHFEGADDEWQELLAMHRRATCQHIRGHTRRALSIKRP